MKRAIKYLTVLTFFLLFHNAISAQIRVGVKGGIDIIDNDIVSDIFKVTNNSGYQIGGTLEALVPTSKFGVEASVLYCLKKYDVEDKANNASISDYNYISIPINFKQRISIGGPIGLFAVGGVYGNVKVKGGDFTINQVANSYKAKDFAFGLNAGAGISILGHVDIGVYFRGELTERYAYEYMDAATFQNKKFQTWSVGATLFF